ncbi:MAG: hypothetical protein HLUCCA12_10090 [Rhodobacteraceae bacterium HLUCCA12]|nr:MAG: hypothetical protein HLUCCA12_10090 [Rhodobacteraceae bacterium HLUCCA12]
MQVILHKTPLLPAAETPPSLGLELGDAVELEAEAEGTVRASIWRHGMWLPLVGRRARRVPLGHLRPEAAELVAPALSQGTDLRVRVVEICPAHLSEDGRDYVCLSIWGDRDRLRRARERPVRKDRDGPSLAQAAE